MFGVGEGKGEGEDEKEEGGVEIYARGIDRHCSDCNTEKKGVVKALLCPTTTLSGIIVDNSSSFSTLSKSLCGPLLS